MSGCTTFNMNAEPKLTDKQKLNEYICYALNIYNNNSEWNALGIEKNLEFAQKKGLKPWAWFMNNTSDIMDRLPDAINETQMSNDSVCVAIPVERIERKCSAVPVVYVVLECETFKVLSLSTEEIYIDFE